VGVLEDAGLVATEKVGRVRYCRLSERRLDEALSWIDAYHRLWTERFAELDRVLEELQRNEQKDQSDGHTNKR